MSTPVVVIVGAGRVGLACARLLQEVVVNCDVVLIDENEAAIEAARATFYPRERAEGISFAFAPKLDILEAKLRELQPFAIMCCTPFHVNIPIATICMKLKCHYLDFTEDVSVTKAVTELSPVRSTFVLQTGLAPGLVTSIGLAMVDQLQLEDKATPTTLTLRVGALPRVGTLPAAYSLTWSSAGLINEYYQPVEKLEGGVLVLDEPLDSHEELIVDGLKLEAFNTSGGLGAIKMYTDRGLTDANYKTLRYPGHLEFLQKKLMAPLTGLDGTDRIKLGVAIAESLFPYTRDDVVYMVVRAQGVTENRKLFERSFNCTFDPADGMTALELTTAGTGVATVELLMRDALPKGIVFGGEVLFSQLRSTKIWARYFQNSTPATA